ncbi:unnamed protein product, partial [Brassica oleracea]
VCCVKCWFVDDLFIIIKLHVECFLYIFTLDGHDSEDTKQSTADMTAFVQNLLQQMVGFLILTSLGLGITASVDNHHMVLCLALSLIKLLCYAYLVGVSPTRNHLYYHDQINELEQSINDLRAEMGVEGTPPPASKSGDEPKTPAS